MPDDKSKKKLDAARINVHEPYKVKSWCNKLGCTEKQLKDAIKAVGTSVAAVKEYFKNEK